MRKQAKCSMYNFEGREDEKRPIQLQAKSYLRECDWNCQFGEMGKQSGQDKKKKKKKTSLE
jgi:hypothetical protein